MATDLPSLCDPARWSNAGVLHLLDPTTPQYTRCGLPLSDAKIGGYCEHLDGNLDHPKWLRMIFGYDGRSAEPCPTCLDRQPRALAQEES